MSEVITHINKYKGNNIFAEYPIGALAENISYTNNHVESPINISVQEFLDENVGGSLTIIGDGGGKIIFNGSSDKVLDLSKYATDADITKLNDLGKMKANQYFHLKKVNSTGTTLGNSFQRYYGDGKTAAKEVPKFDSNNSKANSKGQYTIKNGWRWLTSFKIPKGQTWLVTYNVSFSNRYRGTKSKAANKDSQYYIDVCENAKLGRARGAMLTTIGTDAPSSTPITGIDGYTGDRSDAKLSGWSTIVNKTVVLPHSASATVSSKDITYHLWAQQDADYTLPCSYDITAIRIF